jgi:xylitol oxidase
MDNRYNWAGNYAYSAMRLHRPDSVAELQEIVAGSSLVKALGTRHSFNGIADTTGDLISVERLDGIVALDREHCTVTVEAGVRYGTLCRYLDGEGFALHNLASLPHISVAGACATATHGSGDGNACLATAVTALEMVTAGGEIVSLSRERDPETFPGAVVGLGALGILTRLTLVVEPAYMIRQVVYENLPLSVLTENFEEITSSAYSVSLFTDWRDDRINQVWRKSRVPEDASGFAAELTWFGATLAPENRHPLAHLSAENCTEQRGIPGPWFERLPHFRMEFTPSSGEELQSEYLVPRKNALAALQAISGLRDQIAPLLQIAEMRTIAADDLWMSPFYRQPCVGFHFTWLKDWPGVRAVLPRIEADLTPFDARPHWGKLFTLTAEHIQSLYPRLPDFQELRRRYDPTGKLHNTFLDAAGI